MRKPLAVFIVLGMTLGFVTVAWSPSAIAGDGHYRDHKGFTLTDLRGSFGFSFQGTILDPGLGPLPVAATGWLKIDGKGNITDASRTINVGGKAFEQTFSCTLTVFNSNGTGSAECPIDNPLDSAPDTETFDFVVDDDVNEYRFVSTNDGIVILGTGIRQRTDRLQRP